MGSAIKLAAALPPFLSLHTTNGRLPTQTLVSETQGSLEKDLVCVPLVLDRIGGFYLWKARKDLRLVDTPPEAMRPRAIPSGTDECPCQAPLHRG